MLVVLVLGAAATGFAVFVLPQIAGAGADWRRVRDGNGAWLLAAAAAEVASYAGYVALLRTVFERRVGWRESFLITMAAVAATRLATAGAGGIVLTTWALRRLGLSARRVARGMVAFLVTLYAVYLAALAAVGVGLGTAIVPGGGGPLLTLMPAGLAASVVLVALLVARASGRIESRLGALARRGGRLRRPVERLGGLLADGAEGIALVAVLAYRLASFGLPTVVGAPASVALHRSLGRSEG